MRSWPVSSDKPRYRSLPGSHCRYSRTAVSALGAPGVPTTNGLPHLCGRATEIAPSGLRQPLRRRCWIRLGVVMDCAGGGHHLGVPFKIILRMGTNGTWGHASRTLRRHFRHRACSDMPLTRRYIYNLIDSRMRARAKCENPVGDVPMSRFCPGVCRGVPFSHDGTSSPIAIFLPSVVSHLRVTAWSRPSWNRPRSRLLCLCLAAATVITPPASATCP
jgi:hypothetical protein